MNDEPIPRRIRNIAELAQLAGVSAATVSRALTGSPLVNARTRDHVQALARTHDFRPNQMARRLRTRQTGAIGVVIPLGHDKKQHISDPFFMTMLGHLADDLTENGYDIVLSRVIPDADDWLDRIVDSGMLDGVLLIGQSDQLDIIERVARRYLPLVVWGSFTKGQTHCSVGTDNFLGGRLAAEYILEQGARSIAFLGDPRPREFAARLEGVRAAVSTQKGVTLTMLEAHLAREVFDEEIVQHLARLTTPPDAIIAATDVIAMGALRALADRGITVPQTMRVIGYDDLPIAMQTVPRLTTIRQDIAQGARHMVEALFARIAGEEAGSVVMPPSLIIRRSA
jgi:DNA-binding LacI/PurR family transcriptional regulator